MFSGFVLGCEGGGSLSEGGQGAGRGLVAVIKKYVIFFGGIELFDRCL